MRPSLPNFTSPAVWWSRYIGGVSNRTVSLDGLITLVSGSTKRESRPTGPSTSLSGHALANLLYV